jgi:hypothetical protein
MALQRPTGTCKSTKNHHEISSQHKKPVIQEKQIARSTQFFSSLLAGHQILASPTGEVEMRMVTHCDVDRAGIDRALSAFAEILS